METAQDPTSAARPSLQTASGRHRVDETRARVLFERSTNRDGRFGGVGRRDGVLVLLKNGHDRPADINMYALLVFRRKPNRFSPRVGDIVLSLAVSRIEQTTDITGL